MSKYKQLINTPAEKLKQVIQECGSIKETLRWFGWPNGDTRAHRYVRQFVDSQNMQAEASAYLGQRTEYTDENLITAVKNARCVVDVMRSLGLKDHGGNRNTVCKRIATLGLSTDHFDVAATHGRGKKIFGFNDIFCENSKYHRSSLTKAAKRYKILEYKCCSCGNEGVWMGKPMQLVIDHINGINNDNRVDNLRMMCYNCHSQTPTFAGRNVG